MKVEEFLKELLAEAEDNELFLASRPVADKGVAIVVNNNFINAFISEIAHLVGGDIGIEDVKLLKQVVGPLHKYGKELDT